MPENEPTPLSDLIERLTDSPTDDTFARFVAAFRQASVGVIIGGLADGRCGTIVTSDNDSISLGETLHANGRPMILTFADPAAFLRRFGDRFNGETSGETVLATVMAHESSEGVLVNSAKAEISVMIDRAAIRAAMSPSPPPPQPRKSASWWRFGRR